MAKKLTPKQKKFADKYLETGNASLSAREAYDANDATARVIGSNNLTKDNVIEYLQAHGMDAANVMVEIMNDKTVSAGDRRGAAKDVLDRSIGKATEKHEVEHTGNQLTGMVVVLADGQEPREILDEQATDNS